MKATIVFIAVVAFVALAEGGELADLSQKQKAAVYSPHRVGLESYVVEFTASIWAQIPQLKDAKLVYDSGTGEFTAEDVVADDAAGALESMKIAFQGANGVGRVAYYRVTDLEPDYSASISKLENGYAVTAEPVGGVPKPNRPIAIVVNIDDRGLLVRHLQMKAGGARRTYSDFEWAPAGEKWIPVAYTRTEGGKETRLTMTWGKFEGFYLPVKVSAVQVGNFEHVYTYRYRKVAGSAENAGPHASPEATVKSFIEGCASRDVGLMAKCFHEDAESEFDAIRGHRTTQKQLDELKAAFGASKVKSTTIAEDGKSAVVRISMMRGDRESEEQIELAPDEHGDWKIVSF